MNPQKPAEGISSLNSPRGDVFEVGCDCGDRDHNHRIIVDTEYEYVSVNLYVDVSTHYRGSWDKRLDEFLWRVKTAAKILFTGIAKFDSSTLLTKQQALNYSEALKNAIERTDND